MIKTVLTWITLEIASGVLYAQSAVVEKYTAEQYGAGRTNWDATIDSLGLLYVGNEYGLLVFDGSNWSYHTIPGRNLRSVETGENGTVYWGSDNNFGYLHRDEYGNLSVISLKSKLSDQLTSPATVFQILSHQEHIYFETQNGLIYLNELSQEVTYHPFKNNESIIIDTELVEGNIYIISDDGLFTFKDGRYTPVSTDVNIDIYNINSILPYNNNRYIIVDWKEGLYTIDKNFKDKKRLNTSLNSTLSASNVYLTSKAIPAGNSDNYEYLIVSFNGLFHIDHKGKLIEHYNTEKGLSSNTILEVFPDPGSFWVSTDAGMSQISRSTLLRTLPGAHSNASSLYSAHYRSPYYYIGTTNGMVAKHDSAGLFEKVSGSGQQTWDLVNFKSGILAAGGNEGILYLEQNRVMNTIPTETAAMTVHPLRSIPATAVVGLYNGAGFLDARTPNWHFSSIPFIQGTIQSITEDADNNIWVGTRYDGIYKIHADALTKEEPDSTLFTKFDAENGVSPQEHHNVFLFRDTLISTTSTGFLYFDKELDTFSDYRNSIGRYSYPDVIQLSDTSFFLGDDLRRMLITAKKDGSLSADENYFNVIPSRIKDIDRVTKYSYLVTTPSRIYEMNLNSKESSETNYDLWLTFTSTKPNQRSHTTSFTHSSNPALTYAAGSQISVSYSLPNQAMQNAVQYRFRLLPVDTLWSSWSNLTEISWQSLASGDYELEIDVLKPAGSKQQYAAIPFSIDYHWYNGPVAFLFYFGAAGLLIWGIIYTRQYNLIKRNNYLEALVRQRTEEITDQNRSLKEQKTQLLEANRIKSHYLNMAVHDLKNPLGAIKGFSELIEEEKENPIHIQTYAEQILKVTKRMLSHIDQLLETERKQIKMQKDQFTHVHFASVIQTVIDQNHLQAQRKNQTISTTLNPGLYISGDSLQLFQMVDNLLSNAIKFSPVGSSISLKLQEDEAQDEIIFTISDEGPGIDPKYHRSLFEPWVKTNNKPTGDETSSGLGLTIVKEIVDMHEGTISLKTPDKGTSFEIRFPKS